MTNDIKKLSVWKCGQTDCLAEFIVGKLSAPIQAGQSVKRCPFCYGSPLFLVKSMEYIITETKMELPDANRVGSVARRPLEVQGEASDNTV